MVTRLNRFLVSATLLGALCAAPAFSQAPGRQPDNTGVNKRDRKAGEPTADQAKNDKSDLQIMKEIRKSIVADKSLSTYAHNVKVIAQNGKVTLKGPVHTDDESKAVESKATEVAGAGNVTNELTVKPAKKK
ncbi:MAG: BON domain-containing protein [Terriglobia bacterium]